MNDSDVLVHKRANQKGKAMPKCLDSRATRIVLPWVKVTCEKCLKWRVDK